MSGANVAAKPKKKRAPAKKKKAGIYPGILEAAYHADPVAVPSLSSSIAKTIITQSPAHAWMAHPRLNKDHETEHRKTFDLGSASHDLLLGQPDRFVVVVADNWQTKAAKAERDEARAVGKLALLESEMDEVTTMVEMGKGQLAFHEDGALFLDPKCTSEQTMIWKDGAAWCRARTDRMSPDCRVIFDYKTTMASAHPDEFGSKSMWNLGYDVQAEFYRRGAEALLGHPVTFLFVVQERKPPYALSVLSLDGAGQMIGAAKVDMAIDAWTDCMARDRWPGYPNRTVYVAPPIWQQRQWLDPEGMPYRPEAITDAKRALADQHQRPQED